MTQSKVKWVRLGDYIKPCDLRNEDGTLGEEDVRGLSTSKAMITTKANLTGVNLKTYKVVRPRAFAYVADTSRRGDKISMGYNFDNVNYIVSNFYVVFEVKDENVLSPDYLFLIFNRSEFDRYARWDSWGSAREYFWFDDISRYTIPLPSITRQREIVETWQGLRKMKEENEQIAEPLLQLCQSYIQDLKKKYPMVEIGPWITRVDKRNSDNAVKVVKSVSVTKEFNDTNAKVDKNNLGSYKIVMPKQISFVQTTGNEKCLCAALNDFGYPVVVTSVNEVFECNPEKLLPEYVHLYFRRKETDRYARFHSWGSARETFTWSDMQRFRIPLPPIDVQHAIVNIYNCAKEAKRIANEADQLSRDICPALMQQVINE